MDHHKYFSPSALSLRSKLVLSYLVVIVGTVLALSYAVSAAAEQYFSQVQQDGMIANSQKYVDYGRDCLVTGRNCENEIISYANAVFVTVDIDGEARLCIQPQATRNNCENEAVQNILHQTLLEQDGQRGSVPLYVNNSSENAAYISKPVFVQGNRLIGAIFLSQGLLSTDFNQQTNNSILIVGCLVATVALLVGILLVRRFIRPLEILTVAAEQMKRGQYARRVPLPRKLDELGLLGLTFNEMADTIEADITELRRQDQVRRDLIANIAHDLATPLTAIQGFSEALADDVITDPTQRQETAQRIGREVQRLRRLVADVQQMSSLEAGRTRLDLAPLDMHTLVSETVAVIVPECEQQGIELHNDITSQIPQVQADGDRITQVLLNLVDNARRHTPSGGHIHIGAMVQQNFVSIWVRDTGSGIDPVDLPHVFERFYRADRSRTKATGGSGLGLSIVKAIIAAHGGMIWAESIPGHGTRVIFTLPMVPQAQLQTIPGTRPLSRDGSTRPYPPRIMSSRAQE